MHLPTTLREGGGGDKSTQPPEELPDTPQLGVSGTKGIKSETAQHVSRNIQSAISTQGPKLNIISGDKNPKSACLDGQVNDAKDSEQPTNSITIGITPQRTTYMPIQQKSSTILSPRYAGSIYTSLLDPISSSSGGLDKPTFITRAVSNICSPEGQRSSANSPQRPDERRDPQWQSERVKELSDQINLMLGEIPALSSSANTTLGNYYNQDSSKLPSDTTANNDFRRNAANTIDGGDIAGIHNFEKPLNLYKVPDGVMQVFIMSLIINQDIKRPYVVVTFGDQVFQTSVANKTSGDWNEGFELIVSYHMQLFGTIHFDVCTIKIRFWRIGLSDVQSSSCRFWMVFLRCLQISTRSGTKKQAPSSLPGTTAAHNYFKKPWGGAGQSQLQVPEA